MRCLYFSFILSFILIFCGCAGSTQDLAGSEKRIFKLCLEVQDGDTVVYRGVHMRFLGVDTPEVRNPEIGFYKDQPYGLKAKEYTRVEIRKARIVTYMADGYDRYNRLLVHVFVDGYPLSLKIIEAGLGYETVSVYGDNGFPEIADRILISAKLHHDLPFENPYMWRQKNRKR